MGTKKPHTVMFFFLALGVFAFTLAAFPVHVQAGPLKVEAVMLPQRAADPYAVQVSLGPRHEYDPVYYAPAADICPILSFRVLVLRYAHHDNLVVEELEYAGDGCREIRVRSSYTINGVRLGYLLEVGSQFA